MSIYIPESTAQLNGASSPVKLTFPAGSTFKAANVGFVTGAWIETPKGGFENNNRYNIFSRGNGGSGGSDGYLGLNQTCSTLSGNIRSGGSVLIDLILALTGIPQGSRMLVMFIATDTYCYVVANVVGSTPLVAASLNNAVFTANLSASDVWSVIGAGTSATPMSFYGPIEDAFFFRGLFPETSAGVPDNTLIQNIANRVQSLDTLDTLLTGTKSKRWRYKMRQQEDLSDSFGVSGPLTPVNTSVDKVLLSGGPIGPQPLMPTYTRALASQVIFGITGNASTAFADIMIEGGTYTGITPTAIHARLRKEDGTVLRDWQIVDAAPTGGVWAPSQFSAVPGTAGWLTCDFKAVDNLGVQIGDIVSSFGFKGAGFNALAESQSQGAFLFETGNGVAIPANSRIQTIIAHGGSGGTVKKLSSANNIARIARGVRQWGIELNALYPGWPISISTVGVAGLALSQWQPGGSQAHLWGTFKTLVGLWQPGYLVFIGHSNPDSGYETILGNVIALATTDVGPFLDHLHIATARYQGDSTGNPRSHRESTRSRVANNPTTDWYAAHPVVTKSDSNDAGPHPFDGDVGQGRHGALIAWGQMGKCGAVNDEPLTFVAAEKVLSGTAYDLVVGPVNIVPAPAAFVETARFGTTNTSGTGSYDTNGVATNGTYGAFTVTAGIISCNGTQTAGTYDVGGWDVEVSANYHAIANQGEWDALTSSAYGKTIILREGARVAWISTANNFGNTTSMLYTVVTGDGPDPRLDLSPAADAKAHFNQIELRSTKHVKIIGVRIAPATKIPCVVLSSSDLTDIHIENCVLLASHGDYNGDYTGGINSFPGEYCLNNSTNVNGFVFNNNICVGGLAGIKIVGSFGAGLEIIGNWYDNCYTDSMQVLASGDVPTLIAANMVTRQLGNAADLGNPHADQIQILPGVDGRNIVFEANGIWQPDIRGQGQGWFISNNTGSGYSCEYRANFAMGNMLYPNTLSQLNGCRMNNIGWLPQPDYPLPFQSGVVAGGVRYGDSFANGTNEFANNFQRGALPSSPAITVTNSLDTRNWSAAQYDAAFPQRNTVSSDPDFPPTYQDLLNAFTVSSSGAAANMGPKMIVSIAHGAEQSTYRINGISAPVLSGLVITPGITDFTATLNTTQDLNPVFWAVVPAATVVTDTKLIKRRRIAGALDYGWVTVVDGQTAVTITGTNGALLGATNYKLVYMQENGGSVQTGVLSQTFTTATPVGPLLRGVNAASATVAATSITCNLPAGTVDGDLLTLIVAYEHGSTINTPAGWVRRTTFPGWSGGNIAGALFTKTAAGEPASVVVTYVTVSKRLAYVYMAHSQASLHGNTATSTSFSVTSNNTVPVVATQDSHILSVWGTKGTAPHTLPLTGTIVSQVVGAGASDYTLSVLQHGPVAAGNTVSKTATTTVAVNWFDGTVELLA